MQLDLRTFPSARSTMAHSLRGADGAGARGPNDSQWLWCCYCWRWGQCRAQDLCPPGACELFLLDPYAEDLEICCTSCYFWDAGQPSGQWHDFDLTWQDYSSELAARRLQSMRLLPPVLMGVTGLHMKVGVYLAKSTP